MGTGRADVVATSGQGADTGAVSSAIGATIRRARKDAGLSVVELAKRTGLSQPHLSQLENGRVTPSIAALYSIAAALGLGADELLPRLKETAIQVARANTGPVQPGNDWPNAASSRLLTGAPGRILEGRRLSIAAGGHMGDWLEHAGEDFVYVLSGALTVELEDGHSETLGPGDCAWYEAMQPHRWRAVDGAALELLLINGREKPPRA